MQVQTVQNQPAFSSLKNPVKAETYISDLGQITIREAMKRDITDVAKIIRRKEGDSFKLMYCSGRKEDTAEARAAYKAINKNEWLRDIKEHLKQVLDKPDGKSTLLVVRNDDTDKAIGFAALESLDGTDGIAKIEEMALDYKYRDTDIAHYLLYKITQSAKGQFKDIIAKYSPLYNTFKDLGYEHIRDHWMHKKL